MEVSWDGCHGYHAAARSDWCLWLLFFLQKYGKFLKSSILHTFLMKVFFRILNNVFWFFQSAWIQWAFWPRWFCRTLNSCFTCVSQFGAAHVLGKHASVTLELAHDPLVDVHVIPAAANAAAEVDLHHELLPLFPPSAVTSHRVVPPLAYYYSYCAHAHPTWRHKHLL